MTRRDAVQLFCETVGPTVPRGDKPWFREAWNNFTDDLRENREITTRQRDTWTSPRGDRCPRVARRGR